MIRAATCNKEDKMLKKRFFKTKAEADVTFEFACDTNNALLSSDTVELFCDFNDWQALPMKYIKKEKVFRAKVRLPENKQFHFRYLINSNEWHNDHKADLYLPNTFGTDNSVVSTLRSA
ncbi:MAG: 1,4-alpha-glucan branching enzyme [Moritella dasanensis]